MKSLRNGTDVMGIPMDRDTRRARLLAARRKPVGSLNRKGILSGHWDAGNGPCALFGHRFTVAV